MAEHQGTATVENPTEGDQIHHDGATSRYTLVCENTSTIPSLGDVGISAFRKDSELSVSRNLTGASVESITEASANNSEHKPKGNEMGLCTFGVV